MANENMSIQPIITDDIRQAVAEIKHAIVVSQSRALSMISGQQLSLYFGIGCYVSEHTRGASWGSSAIDTISQQLQREMPGLRGFSAESIKKMRTFAEFWSQYINRSTVTTELPKAASSQESEIPVDSFAVTKWSPMTTEINRDDFLACSFSHHMELLHKTRDLNEIFFYLRQTRQHLWNVRQLRQAIAEKLYSKDQTLVSNFASTIPSTRDAVKAIGMFKDEYTLDFINRRQTEYNLKLAS